MVQRWSKLIFSGKNFLALVGQNPKKSGKFVSAPLIFSFRYAHAWGGGGEQKKLGLWQFFPHRGRILKKCTESIKTIVKLKPELTTIHLNCDLHTKF
jgi:hypothetical protein